MTVPPISLLKKDRIFFFGDVTFGGLMAFNSLMRALEALSSMQLEKKKR